MEGPFGVVGIGVEMDSLSRPPNLKKGVEMDGDKIRAVLEWKEPENLKVLRGFHGLTGYYRRFVLGFCVGVWEIGETTNRIVEERSVWMV